VVLAEWLATKRGENGEPSTTEYKILDVMKVPGELIAAGDRITLNDYYPGKDGDLAMLTADQSTVIQWDSPLEASEGSYLYVKNAPGTEVDTTTRLEYFLAFLEYPDLTVSNDAYGEFALAPYEEVAKLAKKLPKDRLRKWITDPETDPTRLGLYGLMLGNCGDESDAKMFHDIVVEPSSDFRLGIEGLMAGYLLLDGEKALAEIERTKITTPYLMNDGEYILDANGEKQKVPYNELYAAQQALRFLWSFEPDLIAKERLKESMRLLLKRPNLADIVISDLARWDDWTVVDEVARMYEDEEYATPGFKRRVLKYLMAARDAVPENAETKPEHAKKADTYLAEFKALDPELYDYAQRFFYDE